MSTPTTYNTLDKPVKVIMEFADGKKFMFTAKPKALGKDDSKPKKNGSFANIKPFTYHQRRIAGTFLLRELGDYDNVSTEVYEI